MTAAPKPGDRAAAGRPGTNLPARPSAARSARVPLPGWAARAASPAGAPVRVPSGVPGGVSGGVPGWSGTGAGSEDRKDTGFPGGGADGAADALPKVTLPKGGGAIRGVGDKATVNPARGTLTLSVPIHTPPGRGGFGTELALTYDSGGGNGPFGLGWKLLVPHVTRSTRKRLPRYVDDGPDADTFAWGDEDLVPFGIPDGQDGWLIDQTPPGEPVSDGDRSYSVRRYRPRTDNALSRIERWRDLDGGELHWRVTTSGNLRSVYGRDPAARIADPADPRRVFAWLLEESRDDRGNVIAYTWQPEDDTGLPVSVAEATRTGPQATRYLKRVTYANHTPGQALPAAFEIVFDYGDHDPDQPTPAASLPWPCRADPFSSYRAGFEQRTRRLCRRVLVFHRFAALGPEPRLTRSTDLRYDERADCTHLIGVEQAGYIPGRPAERTAPTTFAYTGLAADHTVRQVTGAALPAGVDGHRTRWVDLDGEGSDGLLAEHGGAWHYARNRGGGAVAPPRRLAEIPAVAAAAGLAAARGGGGGNRTAGGAAGSGRRGWDLLDVDGDGRAELVRLAHPVAGTAARRAADPDSGLAVDGDLAGWAPFRPFAGVPALDWDDPALRFLDVDGDGHPDAVLAGDELLTWYPGLGPDGFGPAERQPPPPGETCAAVLLANGPGEAVLLADMTGDGLPDVVRVRPGDVAYWPNLGYGRFAERVATAAAPALDHPDRFDPGRIRLADVDGSGTADLLYLHGRGATWWPNLAGNAFGAPVEVPLPATTGGTAGEVVDLLGNGTACLVWSSPLPGAAERPLRYVDLTGGKPHLLARIDSGSGGRTAITYGTSTAAYQADRDAGLPWATRLPFPVHVVTALEATDLIAGTSLRSAYGYHHGYWDGAEREFNGFGLVDQWDTETFDDPAADQPPVHVRTWFHTGAYLEGPGLDGAYRAGWWDGDPAAWHLPPSEPAGGLTAAERRAACRALRGATLRQETYSDDGTVAAGVPHAVSEWRHTPHLLQPAGIGATPGTPGTPHAVFRVVQDEVMAHHYDRQAGDPRVSHRLVLDRDALGTELDAVEVAYPRRTPAGPAAAEQAATLALRTRSVWAHQLDDPGAYRVAVPVEQRRDEVTGLDGGAPLTPQGLAAALAGAATWPVEAPPPPPGGPVRLRLCHLERHLYQRDDLSGPLPLGEPGTRALTYEDYQAAFADAQLAAVFAGRVDQQLLQAAGYVRWPAEPGLWWRPSGRTEADPARFYLPVAYRNPWGGRSTVTYDDHALFVVEARDALPGQHANVLRATIHYRVLAPWLVTDPNGNRTAARFDGLGRVTAVAVLGKADNGEGDHLDLGTIESAATDDPTSLLVYDTRAWHDRGEPCSVRAFQRVEHRPATVRWQQAITWSGGLGQELLRKAPAEPGLAPVRGPDGQLVRDGDGRPVLQHTDERWVGTGRVVLNNKGKPVKQYEPYFAAGPELDTEADLVEHGVSPLLRYDGLDRLARVDYPDGTRTESRFGPWATAGWDANDLVAGSAWEAARLALPPADPRRRAALLAAEHAGTPTVQHLDPLGRAVVTVTRSDQTTEQVSRVVVDVEGTTAAVVDPLGNVAVRRTVDLLGREIHATSNDAGEARALPDARDGELRRWEVLDPETGTERVTRVVRDVLRRPTHRLVRDGAGPEQLTELVVYGETHPEAAQRNLRGRLHRRYDGAGLAANDRHDFKSNLLQAHRRLLADPAAPAGWAALAGLADPTDLAALDVAAGPSLEADGHATASAYDALDRVTATTCPDGATITVDYGVSGLITGVRARAAGANTDTIVVATASYDARGERTRVTYGNGATTTWTFEPDTFRLARLHTTRPATHTAAAATLQDLAYTYDPAGNVTDLRDSAQQPVFFNNALVEPSCRYTYDALYRLVEAEGRELAVAAGPAGPHGPAQQLLPHPNNAQALRRYSEQYTYDGNGNLLTLRHHGGDGSGWTRHYQYAPGTNRLAATSLPGDLDGGPYSHTYRHDALGQMTFMPHLPVLGWAADGTLSEVDLGGGGTLRLGFAGEGGRVRKTVDHLGGLRDDHRYLGAWDRYRRTGPSGTQTERITLAVGDGSGTIALIETTTVENGAPVTRAPVVRFQVGDHLGSARLELDGEALALAYEEYHPYGSTAYRSGRGAAETSLKRFRHAGRERDEETGLELAGARWYAPWLGRWLSADPAGLADGPNLYRYCRDNPVRLVDPSGTQSEEYCGIEVLVCRDPNSESCARARADMQRRKDACDQKERDKQSKPGGGGGSPPPTTPAQTGTPGTGTPATPPGGSGGTGAGTPPAAPAPSTLSKIKSSPITHGILGVAYGTLQAFVPGGFLAPSPAPHSKTFEFFRGAGLTATGIAQVYSGLALIVGGGGAAAGGVLATPVTGGASLIVSALGGGAIAVGVAAVAQGLVNVGAGISVLNGALAMSGSLGSTGPPAGPPGGGGPGGSGGTPPPAGGGGGTPPPKSFPNQLPKELAVEQARAAKAGVTPIPPKGAAFDKLTNSGEKIKWAVTESGELLVIPKNVPGHGEMSHAIISNGKPVIAAGEAEIAGSGGKYIGLSIDRHSGHFKPDAASLQIGKDAFAKFGIIF